MFTKEEIIQQLRAMRAPQNSVVLMHSSLRSIGKVEGGAEALLDTEEVPTPVESPYAEQINGLKAVIHTQNEEIARLCELKEHLESRVTFLLEQIERKDRRMDEKDQIIKTLMEKCL